MELKTVYKTNWLAGDARKRHSFRSTTSSWSSINQIAFTSDSSGENLDTTKRSRLESQGFVHILDPNKPWDIHSFDSGHSEVITELHWNPSGSHLLTGDRSGVFKLWAMKNSLVNDWYCERTVSVGEKPVCTSWLGTSAKFLFCDAPKDFNHLMNPVNAQNFPRCKVKHPLAKFIGMSRDGWITITETGKIYFVSMNQEVSISMVVIDTDLQGIKTGDISFANDIDVDMVLDHNRRLNPTGYIIIGLADGLVGSAARFYKVYFQFVSTTSISIKCSTLQTLLPACNKSSHPYAITHIKFVYTNSGAHVFICNKGLLKSCIERWHLTNEPQQLHEVCQRQLTHTNPPPIKTWERVCLCVVRKHVSSLAVPWLPVEPDKNQNFTYPGYNLVLGFSDGYLRIMNSLTLEIESEFQNFQYLPGRSVEFLSLHYSPCSCCILGFTGDGTMYLFKCQPTKAVSHLQVSMAMVNLLEYCVLSGWEWWDVLVTLKHQSENIIETTLRLFEQNAGRNLSHSHQNSKYLSIKAGLLRLTSCTETKVRDCYSKQFLFAIGNFFKSLIPGGDEALIAICQQPTELSHQLNLSLQPTDQILDPRDYEVDIALLKTLHPLVQWLSDCCVSFIGILVVQQGRDMMPGVSLFQDTQCILLIKQLLLLVSIWAKQDPGLLPYYAAPIENFDCLVYMFKMVSQLWMVNKQTLEKSELEASALEKEVFFANHLNFIYQSLVLLPANLGVTGKHAYIKPDEPDEYEFGHKPRDRMLPLKKLATQCGANTDVIMKLFLGNIQDEKLRQCTKCEGLSFLNEGQQESAWEQMWTRSCVCGGAWKRVQDT